MRNRLMRHRLRNRINIRQVLKPDVAELNPGVA